MADNLKKSFQDLAVSALTNAFRDLSVKATLKRVVNGPLKPGGGYDRAETTQALTVIIMDFRDSRETSVAIEAGDRKVLVAGKTLKVVPNTDDLITFGGVDHQIMAVKTDAAQALYTLHVRAA